MNLDIIRATRPKEEDFLNFKCNIPNLNTNRIVQANGYFSDLNSVNAKEFEGIEEIIISSVETAKKDYAKVLDRYGIEPLEENGIFIYIPEDISVDIPIQMLDIIKADRAISINTHNIVVLEKNSKLKLIHCDDSVDNNPSVSKNKTNVFLDAFAELEYYKMENINNSSSISTSIEFSLEKESKLTTFWLSINGGDIKNDIRVDFNDEDGSAELNGLYLTDKEQIVDNKVRVNHNKPNCFSSQLYKGILDDSAQGNFNGQIYVAEGASKTLALQNNNNILLTDKAIVNTLPFLEIYNDDVKCSHGATIGQLDDDAMFYLRTRGISERNSRMLLMYAFCNDVLAKASIVELKDRLSDVVKRRLHGELSTCESCVLHCSTPDKFEIDLSII